MVSSPILDSETYKQSVAARIRHSEDERIKRQRSMAAGKPQLFGDSKRYIAPWWSEDKADPIYQFAKQHGIAHPVTQLGDLLEPGVKLVAVWRTCLSEEQVYARILEIEQERLKLEEPPVSQNQVTTNEPEPVTNTPEAAPENQTADSHPIPNSPRGKYAVALLQGGYAEQYAECHTMGEVYKKLQELGYMYVEAMGLWVGGGKAHLQVEDGSALHERLVRAQGAQDDMPLDESDDGAPEELNDSDATAASLPDGESGVQDDTPLEDEQPDPDDELDDPDNHTFAVGTKVVYCGDSLFMPNGDFTAVPGTVGQITELLLDNQVMVAFVGRAGEVSVPLTDLRHEGEGCNKYGEPPSIQRGNLVELHPGDQVSAGSQAGYVIQVLPGDQALVQYIGWTEPRRVSRAGLVVTKTALEAAQENIILAGQISKAQADNTRLQQLLQQAKDEASKPAPLPNLGELDVLRAENAALKAQIEDMRQVNVSTAGNVIPDGDLFSELRILQARERRQTKKEYRVEFDVDAVMLGSLLNDGWEKFDSGFMCDEHSNFYSVVFCRDLPTPQPERRATQHEPMRTADDVTYIIPPDAEPTPSYTEALRSGIYNSAELSEIATSEARSRALSAVEANRQERESSDFRSIRDVIALPTMIVMPEVQR